MVLEQETIAVSSVDQTTRRAAPINGQGDEAVTIRPIKIACHHGASSFLWTSRYHRQIYLTRPQHADLQRQDVVRHREMLSLNELTRTSRTKLIEQTCFYLVNTQPAKDHERATPKSANEGTSHRTSPK